MKKIAGLALVGFVLFNSFHAIAQTYTEQALLFSRIRPGGSARIQALGSAQVSLGGDYSSGLSNPAGLGMFNRSEITFSPAMNFNSTSSDYLGTTTDASKTQFVIPGFSLVFHNGKEGNMGFLGGSFGITYNRLNDFNRTFQYGGNNDKNSIIDAFISDATGLVADDLAPGGSYSNNPTATAYNTYLIEDSTFINPGASNTEYWSYLGTFPDPADVRTVDQLESVKTTGSQDQVSLSYGANFNDKVFLGGGIGFTNINFNATKVYRESNYHFVQDPTYNPVDYIELTEHLTTSGSGINGSLGIIVRPIDVFQIGFSYNSPTWYHTVADNYSASMISQWNNFDYNGDGTLMLNDEGDQTDEVISNYELTTPSRINIGSTVFIAKSGFVTADLEFVNYSGPKMKSTDVGVDYDFDNEKIKNTYQSVMNLRVGGEFRVKSFRARGGYAFMPDPFKTTQNGVKGDITNITAGVGYRGTKFYIDLALVMSDNRTTYRPYVINTPESPLVTTRMKNSMVMVTVGFPFTK